MDNRCYDEDGEPTQAIGKAEPVEDEVAKLKVTFLPKFLRWIPFTEGDYWVLKLDPEYQVALVGTPDRKHLWLLARESSIAPEVREEYRDAAVAQGYDLAEWIDTPQSGGRVTDDMVED